MSMKYTADSVIKIYSMREEIRESGSINMLDLVLDAEMYLKKAGLSSKQMSTLQLYCEGYTMREIAERQGVTTKAVSKQLATIKKSIQKVIDKPLNNNVN